MYDDFDGAIFIPEDKNQYSIIFLDQRKRFMTNHELHLALDFIENTNRNVFLTGKAGTGKTTFLKNVKANSKKRLIVVAPTGVAAINAQGVTIHSFFQVPFGPLVPDKKDEYLFQKKMKSSKINIIRSLDLLIIDEISMVRADLLDGIDNILRKYRYNNKPFGGIQLLLIGDINQLAPVTKQEEWNLLSPHYETPFFFSSLAFKDSNFINIELYHIYRQENKEFIGILEEIRNNRIEHKTLSRLNERYFPDFEAKPDEGYITLTTHNYRAETINSAELNKLKSKSKFYKSSIDGNFPEYSFPTQENLELKQGAQVMYVKNDTSVDKRYYNGKIGLITELKADSVMVITSGESSPVEVKSEKWENISYSLNAESKNIEEKLLGTFEQIPLKLAWAITIHKSQGLTFDKAIIDAQSSFAHGQTYVALSRCRTLEGIILKTKINDSSIINDDRVKVFTSSVRENLPEESTLIESKKAFQMLLIKELFDFKPMIFPLKNALSIAERNQNTLKGKFWDTLINIKTQIENHIFSVSENFSKQIENKCNENDLPENSEYVRERISKAVEYYLKYIYENIKPEIDNLIYTTDNKEVRKEFEKQIGRVEDFIHQKIFCFKGLNSGFEVHKYLELRAKAAIDREDKPKKAKSFISATQHPELFNSLRAFRDKISRRDDIDHFQVFTQASLYEICEKLPENLQQLKKINGIGKVRMNLYGSDIIEMVREYCNNKKIEFDSSNEIIPEKKKPQKGETYQITLVLLRSGLKPDEIAKERNLALSTIEGHLAKMILSGEISIEETMDTKRVDEFTKLTIKAKTDDLNHLKPMVGEEFSYGELRMLINHKQYLEKSNKQ